MATVSMSTVSDALKLMYLPAMQDQMNYEINPFYAKLEKNSDDMVKGLYAVQALRYGKNGGVGNRSETGALPTPNSRKTLQVKIETKNVFARILISDKITRVGVGGQSSFVNILTKELDDALADSKDSVSRQVFGNGTGVLTTISAAASASTTLYVADPYILSPGMQIDIYSASGTAAISTCNEITNVDYDNKKITVASAVTCGSAAFTVVNGNYGLEMTGLGAVFGTGNLYGVARSTYTWMVPTMLNQATSAGITAELDELYMQRCMDLGYRRAGTKFDFILCSDGVRRAFQYMNQVYKRNTEIMKLEAGYDVVSFNGIPLVVDMYAPASKMFFLSSEEWKLHRVDDWDWLEKDGAILSRISGYPTYEATLALYADLACSVPGGQAQLYGITEH